MVGSPGNVPISAVTAAVVPGVRVTVRDVLSILPLGNREGVHPTANAPVPSTDRQHNIKRRACGCYSLELTLSNLFQRHSKGAVGQQRYALSVVDVNDGNREKIPAGKLVN